MPSQVILQKGGAKRFNLDQTRIIFRTKKKIGKKILKLKL